jgi:hypothetical protein
VLKQGAHGAHLIGVYVLDCLLRNLLLNAIQLIYQLIQQLNHVVLAAPLRRLLLPLLLPALALVKGTPGRSRRCCRWRAVAAACGPLRQAAAAAA